MVLQSSTEANAPEDEREAGYDARMRNEPLAAEASAEFKAGWFEADQECWSDDTAEF